jgi:hypothetical protein
MTIIGDLSFVHTFFSLYIVVRARVLASWYLLSSSGFFNIVGAVAPSTCRCFFRIFLNLFYSYFAIRLFLSFDGDAVRVVVLLLGVLRVVVALLCLVVAVVAAGSG